MKKPMEAIIEDVVIKPKKIQPIIVNFQNGTLKDTEAKNFKCGLFHDAKVQNTVLALSNGKICYKGYRPDLSQEIMYTMLAIHNKRTGKVRLVQAERWDVSPVLDKHVENNTMNSADKQYLLSKRFGSKKSQRRTEQYQKLQVNMEAIKEDLQRAVSNIEIQQADLVPQAKDSFGDENSFVVPNTKARHPSEVYNVEDIVPLEILKTFYDSIEPDIMTFTGKSKFFENSLPFLLRQDDYKYKVSLLLYIEAVKEWLGIPIKLFGKNLNICPLSPEAGKYILDKYSTMSGSGRLRPNSMKDKGIVHCMIIGLTLNNYVLNLEEFNKFINVKTIGMKKLYELSSLIRASRLSDQKSIALQIPLPAAMVLVKPTKRKRNQN